MPATIPAINLHCLFLRQFAEAIHVFQFNNFSPLFLFISMRSPLRIGFHVIYEFAAVPPIHTMRTGTADSHFSLVKRSDNYKCGNDKNNNRNYLLEKGDIQDFIYQHT